MSEFIQRKPFFMVYSATTCYARKRHKTIEDAEAEALRMASIHPYDKFHVIMSLGRATGSTNEKRAYRKTPKYQEHLKKKAERRAAKKQWLANKKALADETNKR